MSSPPNPASTGVILKNATLACAFPAEVRRGDVRIVGGQIAEVGEGLTPLRDEEMFDCAGRVVMPGLVAAHTHLSQSLAPPPGLGATATDCPVVPRSPHDGWLATGRAHDEASLYSATAAGALAALRRGVTTVIDLTLAPPCAANALEVTAHALDEVGLRGVLAYAHTDLPEVRDTADAAMTATGSFIAGHQGPFLAGMVGLLSPGVLENDTLTRLGDMASRRGVGLHLQAGECALEVDESEREWGLGMVERLLEANILAPRTLLKIGAHLSFEELAIARESGCWFGWCPRTAMLRGDEPAPLEHLPLDRTVVGTDFSSPDVLAELAAGWLQLRDRGTRLPIDRLLLALANSQRLAAQCLGISLGSFQTGAAADLVVYDYDPAAPLTAESLAEHLIYGLPTAEVDAVLVHGRFRVRGGEYVAGDAKRIAARAREDAAAHRARLNGGAVTTPAGSASANPPAAAPAS